jgi:hypothetical protein
MRTLSEKRSYIGCHLSEVCDALIKESQEFMEEVCYNFNGVNLIANQNSTVDWLIATFEEQMSLAHNKYINSDAYKVLETERLLELIENQLKAKLLMEEFQSLDFSDYTRLLNWLSEIQPLSDLIGVLSDENKNIIISTFEQNGYLPSVNTGENFKEDDEDNVARYLIGQALDNLIYVGAIHHILQDFIIQWKSKFKS